jgi:hypothetical protein
MSTQADVPRDGEMSRPACRHSYDPHKGNVPEKGKFLCRCGNKDKIIESIRRLPKDQRLPVRPYALQAYLPPSNGEKGDNPQTSIFADIVGPDKRQGSKRFLFRSDGGFQKRQ